MFNFFKKKNKTERLTSVSIASLLEEVRLIRNRYSSGEISEREMNHLLFETDSAPGLLLTSPETLKRIDHLSADFFSKFQSLGDK